MTKKVTTRNQVHYRDSNNGQFLSKSDAGRKNPATWEKERIAHPSPSKKK